MSDVPQSSQKSLLIKISAPGKVILHGEHSVVYGKLAVAASLGLRTKLTLTELDTCSNELNSIAIELSDLNLTHTYNLNLLQRELLDKCSHYSLENPKLVNHEELLQISNNFIKKHSSSLLLNSYQNVALLSLFYLFAGILGSVDIKIRPFTVTLTTDLTISAGTGSSASYLVTLAAAFIQYARIRSSFEQKNGHKNLSCSIVNSQKFERKDLELISNWAYNAERIVHGPASGVDNTICTFGSMLEFRKGSPHKVIQLPSKFRVLLVNSMVSRDTKVLAAKVAETRKEHPLVINLVLDAIDGVAQSALDTIIHLSQLESPNEVNGEEVMQNIKTHYRQLGKLTDMNQNLLATLGVSHPKLDQICWLLREGGLHGKLTGAGGGGYVIALVPPYYTDKEMKSLVENLEVEGFKVQLADLGGPGVVVDELRFSS